MILSTSEEIRVMFYLISFGVFCISSYDLIIMAIDKKTKTRNIILVIYSIMLLYITIKFSYKLASGYVPIHFILFMVIGFLIYITIRKSFIKGIEYMNEIYIKIKKPLLKILIFLVYPRQIVGIICLWIKTVKATFKNFYKKVKKRNNKLSK
jgi:hypothetical protein